MSFPLNSHSALGLRGILAFNTLLHCKNGDVFSPSGSPGPFTRHLFHEKGNLIGVIKTKPFLAPHKSVEAMRLLATRDDLTIRQQPLPV